jgi:hypothetical protein
MGTIASRLSAALAQRLAATTPTAKAEAEALIADILRGTPAPRQPFDGKQAAAQGRDE